MDDVQGARRPRSDDLYPLVFSASYSPKTLSHLPQPIPNDLPPGLDSGIFTFDDAFEDLLTASQGQRLPDIHTRYEQRKLLRHMFPTGEPTWFWIRRLESRGLIQGTRWHRFPRTLGPDWESFHRELDGMAAEAWQKAAAENSREQSPGHFLYELCRAFKQQVDRAFSLDGSLHGELGSEEDRRRRKEPDTFDELFSSLSSAFAEGQRSWDTFLKIIADQVTTADNHRASDATKDTKKVETHEEHVDRFGYLHSTVTRKTLDKDGNEIGRETFVTMRPAERQADGQLNNQGDDELHHVESVSRNESANKRPGWFWK